jgi:hypothetical protein
MKYWVLQGKERSKPTTLSLLEKYLIYKVIHIRKITKEFSKNMYVSDNKKFWEEPVANFPFTTIEYLIRQIENIFSVYP